MIKRALIALATAFVATTALPAQAAPSPTTFYVYDANIYVSEQTQLVDGQVNWVVRDAATHHLVAWSNPQDSASQAWSLDNVLGPGASYSRTFATTGNYYFRDADRSEIVEKTYSWAPGRVFVVCQGACGRLTIRN